MFSPQVATKSFLRVVASTLKNEQFDCGSRSPHRVSFELLPGALCTAPEMTPSLAASSTPPLRMVMPPAMPPEDTISAPPLLTVALMSMPPDSTFTERFVPSVRREEGYDLK